MRSERPNGSRPTRLACEQLEHRDTPAGNVTAFFNNVGELVVWGDALDNAVSIQQNEFADTIIYGVGGTTVNGQAAIYVGRGALNGVRVEGGFGNDLLEVLGVRTPGVSRSKSLRKRGWWSESGSSTVVLQQPAQALLAADLAHSRPGRH